MFLLMMKASLINSAMYHDILNYIITSNVSYVIVFPQLLVYGGLYFKEIHVLLMKMMTVFLFTHHSPAVTSQQP